MNLTLQRLRGFLGSLTMAVALLIAIATVLAWGTIYETRFGTAAVQRFIYQAWWFQGLLAFLAANLSIAALQRYPWKRTHAPFLLAHLGIILILIGGIVGGRFGIDGQLIIPEGQAERVLRLPQNVLVVSQVNPGTQHVIPTRFETTAWNHEPHALFPVSLEERRLRLVVDRYYPDATMEEHVTEDGQTDNPAIHLIVRHDSQEEHLWLLARDPERFGVRWGDAHLLFLEPSTEEQLAQLLEPGLAAAASRGTITVTLPNRVAPYEIPVPDELGRPVPLKGTPYTLTVKDYFADFVITEQGLGSRSDAPNNPAVAFTLSGPEGTDAQLLFALHPDFPSLHGRQPSIAAQFAYRHPAASTLPPNSIVVLRLPNGALAAVLTSATGERERLQPLELHTPYRHPWLGYEVEVAALLPRAVVDQRFINRGDEVRAEALHLVAEDGTQAAEAWLTLGTQAQLALGEHPVVVAYQPAQRELPLTVKLLDFRKIDYPGTQMAAGFESDVELTDPQRGLVLMRKISMNNPLRYRGYSFYQSSYIPGDVETTVLAVRSDPGTPLVYAGFLIVIAGVVSLFVSRSRTGPPTSSTRRKRKR